MGTSKHNSYTEQQILTLAKKIRKRRFRRIFLRLVYELVRAFFTFIFGILIVASALFVVILTKDNGVYDIGILIFCLPIAAVITAHNWKQFYKEGDSDGRNIYNREQ